MVPHSGRHQSSAIHLVTFPSASPQTPRSGCCGHSTEFPVMQKHLLRKRQASVGGRLRLKCDGTRSENRFLLSAKGTSPFKQAGASVQSTTNSRSGRISGSNAGYTMFRGSMKSNCYPLHSLVPPSIPLPCAIVCHHISTGLYIFFHTIS